MRLTIEYMTSREWIEIAINLGKPDRVPVVPLLDFFSSRYGGITQYEMLFDVEKADRALQETIDDLGSIDGFGFTYTGMGKILEFIFPQTPVIPGVGDAPKDSQLQFVERSIMQPEEYRRIAEDGAVRWLLEKLRASHPQLSSPVGFAKTLGGIIGAATKMARSSRRWRKKGVEPLVATNLSFTPMEWTSLALRSWNDFVLDLFRYPEEIKAANRKWMNVWKKVGMLFVKTSGIRRVFLGGNRTSASFISPKQFEEFALPEWEEMCSYFVQRGITPVLHFDADWTPLLHYLKNLPRAKCILDLDSVTDIFKAKEVLGDHMCITGDVSAAMLKLGSPEEVDEYCRHLIMELGADGGFIMSSGCTVPVDAKAENVRAMIQSVRRYRP